MDARYQLSLTAYHVPHLSGSTGENKDHLCAAKAKREFILGDARTVELALYHVEGEGGGSSGQSDDAGEVHGGRLISSSKVNEAYKSVEQTIQSRCSE